METVLPVIHVTMDDMTKGLVDFVKKIESRGADKWDIAKVIPSPSWSSRPNDRQYQDCHVSHYNIPQPLLFQSFKAPEHEGVYYLCAEKREISECKTFPAGGISTMLGFLMLCRRSSIGTSCLLWFRFMELMSRSCCSTVMSVNGIFVTFQVFFGKRMERAM